MRKLITLVVLVAGCASPRSMDYQRSKLIIDHEGDLLFSTTPNFLTQEIIPLQGALQVINTVLVENVGTKPVQIDLTKALATANGNPQSVSCVSLSTQKLQITLNSREKDYLKCSLILNKTEGPANDTKIVFTMLLPNNKRFENSKVIRHEDF